MTKRFALAACLGSMAIACSSTYPQSKSTTLATKGEPDSKIDITKASMPYKILRAKGGHEVSPETFYADLADADSICVGEQHTNPHHHWVQLEVVDKVSGKRPGKSTALGMEMFQRPFQGVLDDYAAGKISADELRSRAGWEQRWRYDYRLYGPIIDLAVGRHMALLALNVGTELRKKLSKEGMDGLTDEERARLPELVLDDAQHKTWFEGVMKNMMEAHGKHKHSKKAPAPKHDHKMPAKHDHKMPAKHDHKMPAKHDHKMPAKHEPAKHPADKPKTAMPSMARIYRTQVLWDETMADTASRWVTAADGRQVIVIAGNGHCHDSAIVRRMQRRGVESVISVRPIIDDGEGNIAAQLANPMVDYLFVMTVPGK